MKLFGGIAVAVALFGTPALAADMPLKALPAPATINWSGFYIGIEGGGSWGKSDHMDQLSGLSDTYRFNVNGGLVGGTAGYNWQSKNWVFGVEGDWSWSDQSGSSIDGGPAGGPLFSSYTDENWLATVRGRVGYAANSVLLYATGGYAVASVGVGITSTATGAVLNSATQTRSGWTAGGGVEWRFAPSWSAKLEYLYVGLQDQGFTAPNLGIFFDRSNVPLNDNIVRAGINYHFDGPIVTKY